MSGILEVLAVQLKCVCKRLIQRLLLFIGKRRNKVGEFALQHQGQEIATNGAVLRNTVVGSNRNLASNTKQLGVYRSTNDSRDVIIFGNEIPGNDNVKARFVSPFCS